jgi:hypothetical protein
MSPANLKDPFGPSCCDGGEQCSPTEHESAQTCGCDPGINWFCANHKFKAAATEVVKYMLQRAEDYSNDELASTIYTDCAERLQAIL